LFRDGEVLAKIVDIFSGNSPKDPRALANLKKSSSFEGGRAVTTFSAFQRGSLGTSAPGSGPGISF
jgi:hypothetical protein